MDVLLTETSKSSQDKKNKSEEDMQREKVCLKLMRSNNRIASNCTVFVQKFDELADSSKNLKEFDDKVHALMKLSISILNGMNIFKKVPKKFDPGKSGTISTEGAHKVQV